MDINSYKHEGSYWDGNVFKLIHGDGCRIKVAAKKNYWTVHLKWVNSMILQWYIKYASIK